MSKDAFASSRTDQGIAMNLRPERGRMGGSVGVPDGWFHMHAAVLPRLRDNALESRHRKRA
jgi:hypothetical protein